MGIRRAALFAFVSAPVLLLATPAVASGQVLLVGPPGTAGAEFSTVQSAVDAAQADDWILIAPGIYHEAGTPNAGVFIQKPGLHLRGMDRNRVLIDGTAGSGSEVFDISRACPSDPGAQKLGPNDQNGVPEGRNGIEILGVDKNGHNHLADGVYVENLSVCNYLTVAGEGTGGNQIWWNGGDGSGKVGMGAGWGDYLTATTTFAGITSNYKLPPGAPAAGEYGIFTSNMGGPGVIDHSYASNMRDSGFYIGACPDCNQILRRSHAQANADGYSSTNAGGRLIVENNEFDHARVGLTSNAQNNDDAPSPQIGACPSGIAPPAGAMNCTVWRNNYVHDNNNPNTPGIGLTAVTPIGLGMELAATQNVSVIGNRVENQKGWGIVTHDLPDPESGIANCQGGIPIPPSTPVLDTQVCYYFSINNEVGANHLLNDGGFGNPTNADIANNALQPGNCFHDNTDTAGLTSWPPLLQTTCPGPSDSALLTYELACAADFTTAVNSALTCPSTPVGAYPRHDGNCGTADSPGVLTPPGDKVNGVCILPLSVSLNQATMPDPCDGPPPNAFCPPLPPGTAVPVSSGTLGSATVLPNTAGASTPLALLAFAVLVALAACVAVPHLTSPRQRREDA